MKRDQIIVILGGYIVKDARSGRWRTTNFEEHDPKIALGDRLRMVAGSILYKHWHALTVNPKLKIVVSGEKGELRGVPGAPTVASVNENELVALGILWSTIIREEQSNTTYEQLVELTKLLETIPDGLVAIISNRYHLPRIQAMIEIARPLAPLKDFLDRGALTLVSAEDVCLAHDWAAWEGVITRAYASEAMGKIQANEARGVEDIRQGRYKFN